MKKLLFALSAALVLGSSSHAASIVWGAAQDVFFADSLSAALRDNSFVRLGFFNVGTDATRDGIIAANATTFAGIQFLDDNFVEFGSARIGDNVADTPGYVADSDSANTKASASILGGKQMYIWVFKSTSDSSAINSVDTAFETGVFYLNKTNSAAWAFPTDPEDGAPLSSQIDLSDLTGPTGDSGLVTGATVVVGSHNAATSPDSFRLATVVPEPGTAGLAVIGGLALLLRRRRYS